MGKEMTKVFIRKSALDDQYVAEAGDFSIIIERGEKRAPRSVDLLLFGLGACTISTVAHYMQRKGLPTDNLAIELSADLDEKENFYDRLKMTLRFDEMISQEARNVIRGIAKNCRIHRTLERRPPIEIEVAEPADAMTPSAI